jgi:hypothetical protein
MIIIEVLTIITNNGQPMRFTHRFTNPNINPNDVFDRDKITEFFNQNHIRYYINPVRSRDTVDIRFVYDSIVSIAVHGYQKPVINELPCSLRSLTIRNTELATFPRFPPTIQNISIEQSKLSTIPNLPPINYPNLQRCYIINSLIREYHRTPVMLVENEYRRPPQQPPLIRQSAVRASGSSDYWPSDTDSQNSNEEDDNDYVDQRAQNRRWYNNLICSMTVSDELYDLESSCPICLDDNKNTFWVSTCGHGACSHCYNTYLKSNKTCPMCRAPITAISQRKKVAFDEDDIV